MTTITRTDGRKATVELVKQGSEPLWTVNLITGERATKRRTYLGRITRAASDLWMSENGFGWDDNTSRKAAILRLLNAAS